MGSLFAISVIGLIFLFAYLNQQKEIDSDDERIETKDIDPNRFKRNGTLDVFMGWDDSVLVTLGDMERAKYKRRIKNGYYVYDEAIAIAQWKTIGKDGEVVRLVVGDVYNSYHRGGRKRVELIGKDKRIFYCEKEDFKKYFKYKYK